MLISVSEGELSRSLCENTEPFLNQVGKRSTRVEHSVAPWLGAPGSYVVDDEYGRLWERDFFDRERAPYAGGCQAGLRPSANYGFLHLPFRVAPRVRCDSGEEVLSTLARLVEITRTEYPSRRVVLRGQTSEYPILRSDEERERLFGRHDIIEPSLHPSETRRAPVSPLAAAVWCQVVQEHYVRTVGYHPIHRPSVTNEITPFATGNGRAITLAFAQHYGLPTPALDVTTDPLVAVWFATHDMKTTANRTEVSPGSSGEAVIYVIAADPGQFFDASLTGDAALRPKRQAGGFLASNWGNSKNRAARYIAAAVYFPVALHADLASRLPSAKLLFPGPEEDGFVARIQALARGKLASTRAACELRSHLYWVGDDGFQGVQVPMEGLVPSAMGSPPVPGENAWNPAEPAARSLGAGEAATTIVELRAQADAGNVEAIYRLGWLLSQLGDPEGARLLLTAAESGHPAAMNDTGLNHARSGDAAEAERWYRRGAAAGNVLAYYNLGSLLFTAGKRDEAVLWLRRSAEEGDPDGALSLGAILAEDGCHEEAAEWFMRGARGGNAQAAYNLGMYHSLRGDRQTAARWYARSAELGDVDGAAHAAMMRESGE